MQNKIAGVYIIKNKVNNKVYVGASRNLLGRQYKHKSNLKINKNLNRLLRKDVSIFGAENFVFEIIEECEPSVIFEREKYYIKKFKSNHIEYGYNILESQSNFKHKPESIELMIKNREYKYGKDSSCPNIFHFIDPKGNIYEVIGDFEGFCNKNNLSYRTLRRAINKGKIPSYIKSNPTKERVNSTNWEVIKISKLNKKDLLDKKDE